MNFLLTGGSGFIGTHLARLLISKGHPVKALVRKTSLRGELEKAGASFAVGDILSGEGLPEALEGIDCIIHLAGVTKARHAEEFYQCNTEGTRRLAEAAARRSSPPRFVFCSSLAAAGPTRVGKPLRENDIPAPISAYGKSKLAAEQILRGLAPNLPAIIVRPPIVYGPAEKEFLPSILPMAKLGVVLKSGFGPKQYSLIHVDDVCEGLLAAALKGKTLDPSNPAEGVYFISDGHEYTWEEVCGSLARALGKGKPFIVPLPDVVSYAAGFGSELQARVRGTVAALNLDKAREMRCEAWTCSSDRARNEIAYEPAIAIEQGFRGSVEWYRKAGWL
jgi:dihydroflavonol-4-reductase